MHKTVQTGVIVSSQKVSAAYLYLVIRCENLQAVQAGQFVNLEIPGHKDVYLRRPFSIHDVNKNELGLLIKIIGKGTAHLAQLPVGTTLSLIAPLGAGYKLIKKGKALLLGGGCGIAPLLLLAKQLKKQVLNHILFWVDAPSKILFVKKNSPNTARSWSRPKMAVWAAGAM